MTRTILISFQTAQQKFQDYNFIDNAEICRKEHVQILDFMPKSIKMYILPPRQGRRVTKSCDPYIFSGLLPFNILFFARLT